MTIAGQLSVTASDDPRFVAGDSIGIVIDSDCTVTVTQNVEVSAPVPVITTTDAPDGTTTTDGGDVGIAEVSTGNGTTPATA
jgi:hypothetical protein